MLDWGDDDSGLFMKYLRRGSGYYIDVGASELVIDGKIKLVTGRQVERLTETGVVLDDGTELPADLVVYATGYGSMNGWAADLIGQEVADKVGKVWGLGSDTPKDPGPWEGEQRNMWKPTQQEALWFHGGNLHQSRHYSLYLALQLKAREVGIPTPVYGPDRAPPRLKRLRSIDRATATPPGTPSTRIYRHDHAHATCKSCGEACQFRYGLLLLGTIVCPNALFEASVRPTMRQEEIPMPEDQSLTRSDALALTAEIVGAHLSNNAVNGADVPGFIQAVFETLTALGNNESQAPVTLVPAVPIKRSVTDEFIICLEDGKKLKMLKRHLHTAYDMTPEQYRAKWGLPYDYPMVAPEYARKRQELAKAIGLGRKRTPEPVAPPKAAPRRGKAKAA